MRFPAGANASCRRAPVSASPFYYSHLGYFAEVVEAAVANDGQVKINKVWAVGDIGSQVINATAAENMAQGAILDGFGEALNQKITIENGRVMEAQFRYLHAATAQAGPAGRGAFHQDRQFTHRLGRAAAAASDSRTLQRNLRRDGKARAHAANRSGDAEGLTADRYQTKGMSRWRTRRQ